MKGKSLFKKIGAIATTAAMLASVGVTGFAADPTLAGDNDNNGIIVKAPVVTEWDVTNNVAATTETGVYKVVVSYETDTDVTNSIGVTMLAYVSTAGTSLGADVDNTLASYDDTSMKIVGVDQINTEDVTDIRTDKFTFYVDTTNTYGDQIQMTKGQTGIVLLSGDGAEGANGVLFSAGNVDAVVVVNNKVLDEDVYTVPEVQSRPTDEIEAVKTLVAGRFALDPSDSDTNISLTADDITVTAVTGKAYDSNNWQAQNCEYTVTVSKSGYDIADNTFTLEVSYAADAWNFSGTTATVEAVSFPKANVTDTLDNAVKTALVGKKVTFDANDPYTIAEGDIADGKMTITKTSGDYDGALLQNQTLTYALTIPAGAWGRYVLANEVTADVSVTVTAEDNRTVIGGAKLTDGATTLTITNADAPANKTDLDAKVAELIAAKGVVVVKKDDATVTAATTAYSVESTDSYETKPTDTDATLTYTVTVTATDLASAWKFETGESVTFDITVTVQKNAPAGVYGDVDGENGVDDMDWLYVLDWTSGGDGLADFADENSRAYKAADVDGENGIDDMDWMYILDWTSGGVGHENINTNF